MPNLPKQFLSTGEGAIASYSFQNIVTGEGMATYFLCAGETSTEDEYILSGTALISSIATGLLGSGTYEFKTQDFNSPSTLKGTAFFGGYVDDTASGFVLKATLYKEKGTLSLDGAGDVIYSDTDLIQISNTGASAVFKTFNLSGEYVNHVIMLQEAIGDQIWTKVKWYYSNGTNVTSEEQSSLDGQPAANRIFTNSKRGVTVTKIELWGRCQGGSGNIDDMFVYEELTSGLTTTTIASEVTSPTLSAEGGILMEMPLTQTNISIGERVMLKVVNAGTGKLVVDPTNEHNTEETAKINIPVKIDL